MSPTNSPILTGTTYQFEIAYRELRNGNETIELYAINDLEEPLQISSRFYIEGLLDINDGNKAPLSVNYHKDKFTTNNKKVTITPDKSMLIFDRFYLDVKVIKILM